MKSILIHCAALIATVAGLPTQLPLNPDDGNMGGVFGIPIPVPGIPSSIKSIASILGYFIPSFVPLPEPNSIAGYLDIDQLVGVVFPKGPQYPREHITLQDFYDPGTGPYPAHFVTASDLPNHVIYAPKQRPPENVKLPTMVWGNGGCLSTGTAYAPFLTEIASHGYIVIATGSVGAPPPSLVTPTGLLPGPNGEPFDRNNGQLINGFTRVQDMLDSIDWVVKGKADKFGNVDKNYFITAGTSCGGLEAYSAAYHNDRVKLITMFNSATFLADRRTLLKELTAKVAYLTGGSVDFTQQNARDDYASLPAGLPTLRADLNTGHLGTFFAKNGGKDGEAAVALYEWAYRGNQTYKDKWTDPKSPGSMVSRGWQNITMRNFD